MSFTVYHREPIARTEPIMPTDATGVVSLQTGADVSTEQAEILRACELAASLLAGALGRPADQIKVVIGGHVNPGHAPTPGWADEFVTVSVYVSPVDCVCGEPTTAHVVHRADGPCYLQPLPAA